MATLDDLQGTPASLDALSGGEQERVQTTPFSDKNKAAHAALIAGGDIAKDFNVASSDMQRGDSGYAEGLVDSARLDRMSTAREEMYHQMGNPNLDLEAKEKVFQNFMSLEEEQIDFKELLKDDAISSPSQGESIADEQRRLTHAEWSKKRAQVQQEQNKVVQEYAARFENDSLARSVYEMIGLYFLPFAETGQAKRIQEAVAKGTISEGEAVYQLLGNSKAKVVDMLNAVPLDQRVEFTKKLVGAIDTERSTMLVGDNQFSAYTWLRDVVESGYISDEMQFFENAVSVMEALPFFGGAAKLGLNVVRGARGAASVLETLGVNNPEGL